MIHPHEVVIKRVYLIQSQEIACQAFLFLKGGAHKGIIRLKGPHSPERYFELPKMDEQQARRILERDLKAMARDMRTALITIEIPEGWAPGQLMEWLNSAGWTMPCADSVFH